MSHKQTGRHTQTLLLIHRVMGIGIRAYALYACAVYSRHHRSRRIAATSVAQQAAQLAHAQPGLHRHPCAMRAYGIFVCMYLCMYGNKERSNEQQSLLLRLTT